MPHHPTTIASTGLATALAGCLGRRRCHPSPSCARNTCLATLPSVREETILGNVKRSLGRTYDRTRRYTARYLADAELQYRSNCRYDLAAMLPRLPKAATELER